MPVDIDGADEAAVVAPKRFVDDEGADEVTGAPKVPTPIEDAVEGIAVIEEEVRRLSAVAPTPLSCEPELCNELGVNGVNPFPVDGVVDTEGTVGWP